MRATGSQYLLPSFLAIFLSSISTLSRLSIWGRRGGGARFPNPPFSVRSKRLLGAIAPSDSWEHSGNPGGAGAAGHHAPTTWVHPRVYGGW